MRILMRPRIVLMLALFSLSAVLPAHAFAAPTPQEFNVIMNLSGKQRMLSQKMAKEALFVVKGIDVDANRENLKATTDLFKKTLAGLKDGDQSLGLPVHDFTRIQRELDKLQELYGEIDPIYQAVIGGGAPGKDELSVMDKKGLAVLAQANKIVGLFELEAKAVTGIGNQQLAAQINVAGRQRMLTQKMTKELLLTQENVDPVVNKDSMNATIELFSNSLSALKEGNKEMGFETGIKDQAILSQIDTVEKTWGEFKTLLQNADASPEAVGKIKDMNMTLMKQSDAVVQSLAALETKG